MALLQIARGVYRATGGARSYKIVGAVLPLHNGMRCFIGDDTFPFNVGIARQGRQSRLPTGVLRGV